MDPDGSGPSKNKRKKKGDDEEKPRKRSPARSKVKKEPERQESVVLTPYFQQKMAGHPQTVPPSSVPTMAERKVNPAIMAQLATSATTGARVMAVAQGQHIPVTTPLTVKTEPMPNPQGRVVAMLPPKKSPSRMAALAEEEKLTILTKVAAEEKAGERKTISPGLLAYVQQQQLELQRQQQQQERLAQEYQHVSPKSQQQVYVKEHNPAVQRHTPPPSVNPAVQRHTPPLRQSIPVQIVGEQVMKKVVQIPPGHVIHRPSGQVASMDGGLLRQQLLQRDSGQEGSTEAHNIFSAYKSLSGVPYSEAGLATSVAQGSSHSTHLIPGGVKGTISAGGEIRRVGAFSDPQPAHTGDRLSPVPPQQIHVSTIRRTPSPAHQRPDRVSPLPPSLSPAPRTSPGSHRDRTLPVNLSVQDSLSPRRPEAATHHLTQPGIGGMTGGPYGTLGSAAPVLLHSRQLSTEASPSSMMSFAHEQGEILRQTLMRPHVEAGNRPTMEMTVSPRGRVDTVSPRGRLEQDTEPQRFLKSPSPSRRIDNSSPQRVISPDQRQHSPRPGVTVHVQSQSSAAPSTQGKLLTTTEARHRTPSPKPQHRHKESMGGGVARSSTPSSTTSSVSIPTNIGAIRQPVVGLVRLPIPQVTDIKNLPAFSATAMSHFTASSARQSMLSQPPGHEYVKVVPSVPEPRVPMPQRGRVPFSQIQQQQVNPFTFPSKPPNSTELGQHAFHQYELKQEVDIKQEVDTIKREPPERFKKSESPDDGPPRLTPIRTLKPEDQENTDVDMVTMPVPFNKRLLNIANLPTGSLYKSTYRSHTFAVNRAKVGVITSTAKSLDILRANVQKCINKEIDQIIQQYLEKFFKPGIENIKINNGEGAVSEEHVQAVCRQILEEAKKMYSTDPGMSTPSRDIPDNVSETGSTGSRRVGRKRRPSDTDSDKGSYAASRNKKKGRPPFTQVSGRSTPSKTIKSGEMVKREGPKWDTDRLKPETRFVMGARANKALGLGATRGRIYIKHPDVFKYSGDQDDKTWLYENHHMPATGGKAYMLLLEDIQDLAKEEEYRDNPNVFTQHLSGFAIPDWMMAKVKIQMTALRTDLGRVKSRSTTPVDPVENRPEERQEDSEIKLPFTSFSSPKEKERSPSAETEIEFLTGDDNEENEGNDNEEGSNLSPFNLTGGFEEGPSRSPSDMDPMDDDGGTPLSGHFEYTK